MLTTREQFPAGVKRWLDEGYAWATRGKFRNRSWDSLESLARNKRMGLWRMDDPVSPWVFREELKNS